MSPSVERLRILHEPKTKQMYQIIEVIGMPKRLYQKIWLIMRLTTVILIACLMQLSAAGLAQKITLNQRDVPLSNVLKEIRKQSGFDVFSEGKGLPKNQKVTVVVTNASIEEALDQVFKGLDYTYKIEGNTIAIKTKEEKNFLDRIIERFQSIDVTGKIVDENGQPIAGANVKVKGTSLLTSTNSEGVFSLRGVDENAVLEISYLGYQVRELKALKDLGTIRMEQAVGKLEEVKINAGYYSVTDKERTGSISRITSKDIEKQPVNNVLAAMQANLPGVQVVQNTGVPGGGFTIRVRGQNSIIQGNEPFYIIDGVPFIAEGVAGSRSTSITPNASPLASISPSDIESIEVLKDADATAIYGSRGSNGVILITTKRGKSGDTRASVSISQGISRVGKKLNLMNTEKYIEMRTEALANDKISISSTDYDLNGTWDKNRYTDWQKELIGGVAPNTNILTSLSGGNESLTYLIGAAYYKEGTVFPGENTYGRNSGNFSLQYTSNNKKLRIFFDANYSQINSDLFTTDLTQFIALAPNHPSLQNESGGLNWANNTVYVNPIANLQRPYQSKTKNILANGGASYALFKDLNFRVNFGYTDITRKDFGANPLTTFSPAFNYGSDRRQSWYTDNNVNTWIAEGQADWSKVIGKSKLNILLGTTFQQNIREGQEVRGTNYNSDLLLENIAAASTLNIQQRTFLQYRYNAIFGRINYNYLDKYIVNLTGRRDGSTRFGTDNRFANFGALGAAWIISKEEFLKESALISFAKLRASYGITGNDQISDYGYLDLWSVSPGGTYQATATMAPSGLKNPNYAWEVNRKTEVAIELGFLNDRIYLSSGYYKNISNNQLLQMSLAPSTGFNFINDNLPAKVRNTGWEFELSSRNIDKDVFKWSSSVNLTIPRNKLIDYPNLKTSNFSSSLEIGHPLTIRKLYRTSIDQQSGLYIRNDVDKNGVFDANDLSEINFTGRSLYGGLQNKFSYRNLELDFLFQFVKQSGSNYFSGFSTPGSFFFSSPISNQDVAVEDHWRAAGNNSRFQKYTTVSIGTTADAIEKQSGGLAIEDASFIRLKNVMISYNLPLSLVKKMNIRQTKIFVQGQNLLTFTKYRGLDPETLSGLRLPSLQIITAGIQITF